MVMAGADAKRPVLRGVNRTAPSVVPRQQIVRRVVSRSGLARRACATHRLEILVEQRVAKIIAHLRRLGDKSVDRRIASLLVSEGFGPIHRLDQASVRIGSVGIAPLRSVSGVENEEWQKTSHCAAAPTKILPGWMSDRLPHRFLRAALERVDVRWTRSAVSSPPVAIPVIHVEQPVHAVNLRRAISRAQLNGDGVLAYRDRRIERCRVLAWQVEFGSILRRTRRVI